MLNDLFFNSVVEVEQRCLGAKGLRSRLSRRISEKAGFGAGAARKWDGRGKDGKSVNALVGRYRKQGDEICKSR